MLNSTKLLIIVIYVMLESIEFIKIYNGKNIYEYILYNIDLLNKSSLKFIINHGTFIYLLFVIFMIKIEEISIIFIFICKLLDIVMKLYFANKLESLEKYKTLLKQVQINLQLKLINAIGYIIMFIYAIYSV